jgi:hypothetical protein
MYGHVYEFTKPTDRMELSLLCKMHTCLIAFQFLKDHSTECCSDAARSAQKQMHFVTITPVVLTWCLAPKHSHLDVSINQSINHRIMVFSPLNGTATEWIQNA